MGPEASTHQPIASAPTLVHACRSALFYLILILITLLWALPSFFIGIFLPLKARNFWVMGIYCRLVMFSAKVICGLSWQVEGSDNIPSDGRGYVLLSKHQSTWETFFLPLILAPHVQVVKKELLYLPVFGWALNLIHPIFIDRSKKASSLKQVIQQGGERLGNGIHVLVFPEGTRVPPGRRKVFSKGGAMLANKTGAAVIAVAHNSGEYWPNNHWIKRPGCIRVVISPVIESDGKSTAELNTEVEHWINHTVDDISQQPFSGEMVNADSSGKRF
ncbi:1-acyl-sn-glycerol-3-phosphate acyltransferase [Bacterioplanes sanyensis]|uniref:1-acyl-sn-glycerol-3-phosphate acyltransferase n=1 Tax=Bacterioplanes sanyensis TaxID=1249553 RepID=A0A222FFW8_9GAMM|nr:lysophospholipid acyltransferase family protein [Bacterioplanes sanyensis]ASP37975.1 1-acyl-sn-glycerol-3-phosphate acyltransferase [Bacterioplanes sanyensis]